MDTHRPQPDCGSDDCTCEPFEFKCLYGEFRINGDQVEQREAGKWVRIDKGCPDRIGRHVATLTAMCCLLAVLFTNIFGAFFSIDKPNLIRPTARVTREVTL